MPRVIAAMTFMGACERSPQSLRRPRSMDWRDTIERGSDSARRPVTVCLLPYTIRPRYDPGISLLGEGHDKGYGFCISTHIRPWDRPRSPGAAHAGRFKDHV